MFVENNDLRIFFFYNLIFLLLEIEVQFYLRFSISNIDCKLIIKMYSFVVALTGFCCTFGEIG